MVDGFHFYVWHPPFIAVQVSFPAAKDLTDYRQRALGLIARHLPPYFRNKRSSAERATGAVSGGVVRKKP